MKTKLSFFKKLFIHALLMVGLAAGMLYVTFYKLLPYVTDHGKLVQVPDLRGVHVDALDDVLAKHDLVYVITDHSNYSDQLPPFSVLQQSPLQGAWVKPKRKLYLTLNAASPLPVSMPNLLEGSIRQAQLLLTNKGLKIGTISYVPDLAKHAVLEQWYQGQPIPPGKLVHQGEAIDLVVGQGLGKQRIQVPDVLNMPLEEAELVVLEHGMRIKVVDYLQDATRPVGEVVHQTPLAGTQVQIGTVVRLSVVQGRSPE